MSPKPENLEAYQARIDQLERELGEMTVALSQAWDQLVPLLQTSPAKADSADDMLPVIQAAMLAIDADRGAIYLHQPHEWYSLPNNIQPDAALEERLRQGLHLNDTLEWGDAQPDSTMGHWIFTPIVIEQQNIGALGVGTGDRHRKFSAVDLRILNRLADRTSGQVAASQLSLSREREALAQREMHIANRIQRSIQPLHPPKLADLDCAAYWVPARQVGGDAWGWTMQPDHSFTWFVLDVAGKGLPAALAAVAINTAIRMSLRMGLSASDVLRTINDEFYDSYTRADLMVTAAIYSIDADRCVFRQSNAGHLPTWIRRGDAWHRLEATAPPVGVLQDLDVTEQIFALQPDDVIVCSSDGFTEIETSEGFWGERGVCAAVPPSPTSAAEIVQSITAAAARVNCHPEILDDQTLIVVTLHE